MLAPNLLRDNYELKTLVMNGPYLLQIWHFNFKGMLERKKRVSATPWMLSGLIHSPISPPWQERV